MVYRLGAGATGTAGGTLAIGGATTVRFRVRVNDDAPHAFPIANQGTASFIGATTLFALSADSNRVIIPLDASADLEVTKTVDNPTPNVGDTITFTITVTNLGPTAAPDVEVTDICPGNLSFVSATPSQGTYNPATGIWTVGTLPPAAIRAVDPPGDRRPARRPSTNVATVDGLATSRTRTRTTTRARPTSPPPQADLALVKTVNDPTPNVGDNVTFTFTLTNQGPTTATA